MSNFLNCLELRFVRHEDEEYLSKQIVQLAHLKQFDFPVADGIVILPPQKEINSFLKRLYIRNFQDLELSSANLKKSITGIPLPEKLVLYQKIIDVERIWKSLLIAWFEELVSRVHRNDYKKDLSPRLVVFSGVIKAQGIAYLNPVDLKVVINVQEGNLTESIKTQLEAVTIKADKKLYGNFIYHWIVEHSLKITKVTPFTPTDPKLQDFQTDDKKTIKEKSTSKKSYTKIFYNGSLNLSLDKGIDGVIINSASIQDDIKDIEGIEKRIWKLVETTVSMQSDPVIYMIDTNCLKQEAEIFNFVRNKKQLLNLQIGVPTSGTPENFAAVKRELSGFGINRKGTLKLWLEFGTTENFINLDKYLEIGLDGVIINLDQLYVSLFGVKADQVDRSQAVKVLMKFLDNYVGLFKKEGISLLVTGEILADDDLLRFLIDKKVWGVVINTSEQYGLKEYVYEVERFFFPKVLES